MRSTRKDYRPLADEHLDRLKADSRPIINSVGQMLLPARTVYDLVMEVIDLREEVFRLQLCETVEQIIAQELDDDEVDHLAIEWPSDTWCVADMRSSRVIPKPAFPCADTARLPEQDVRDDSTPKNEGRRLPPLDPE